MKKAETDHVAFEILVREHHRRLLGYAKALTTDHQLAEDLVQEALVTAFDKLHTFDLTGNFPAWVRSITRLKYLEFCRTKKETPISPTIIEAIDTRHDEWETSDGNRRTVLSFLKDCIKKLPEQMGQAIELFYSKGLSGREVAESTGTMEETIRKRLERARVKLGDCVTEQLREDAAI